MSLAVKMIAIGYLFMRLNFSIGTLQLIPNWVGYLLILHALSDISEEEPSAKLLRPFAVILAVWEGIKWVILLFGGELSEIGIGVIVTVVSIYFDFQLMTNLANIAERYGCPEKNKILIMRTILTISSTLMAFPIPWDKYHGFTIIFLIITVTIALWLCVVLFSLKRSLEEIEDMTEQTP